MPSVSSINVKRRRKRANNNLSMNNYSLAIQGSYKEITLALFRDNILVDCFSDNTLRASSSLIPCIDTLLTNNNVVVNNLLFIACEAGPGAFTSLRVTLSTVNGISFASGVPLISVDGLEALACSGNTQKPEHVISLLNAFNNEIFYGIYHNDSGVMHQKNAGYCTIEKFIELWQTNYKGTNATIQGSGAVMFKNLLEKEIPELIIPDTILELASIEAVHALGYKKFLKKESKAKLTPLYLKAQTYVIKK